MRRWLTPYRQYQLYPPLANQPRTIAGGQYTDALGRRTMVKYAFPPAPDNVFGGSACRRFPCARPMVEDRFTNWVYQKTPGPVAITDPLGHSTNFGFCDSAALAASPSLCVVLPNAQYSIDPEGIRTDLKHDDNGNVVEARRTPRPGVLDPDGNAPAQIVTSAVYETALGKYTNKPLSMTDARGQVTTWTYWPEHGGVRIQTDPAVNGVVPQKRYSYLPRLARFADGTTAETPIWLLDSMSTCRTGNPGPGER